MSWFAKMIFDEGGALKNPKKSKGYLLKSLNFSKCFFQLFIKKIKNIYKKLTFAAYDKIEGEGSRATYRSRFCNLLSSVQETCINHKFNLLNSKGSILIEFAVCMPVLIILLYYINDLSKLKRYYDQTEFVCQQFVNIIQNLSQNREDKKIKLPEDLKYAGSLAWLSMYPGNTMYYNKTERSAHDLSHSPGFIIYYVKGVSDGKASVIWNQRLYNYNTTIPSAWSYGPISSSDTSSKVVRGSNMLPSTIHPLLKISEGEIKIIVECYIYTGSSRMSIKDYVATDDISAMARKAFKCLLATPHATYASNKDGYYFNTVAIFTPQPGLFNEDRP